MRKIFISYRRDDAEEAAGRLSDHLVNQFGRENIFMDVDGIDPGRDFRKVIDETLIQCDVLLGVIGKNWLDTKDETGRRRLDDASDFVRLEIASALRRDIPVIPVRVQGASIPKPDQLPDDLKDFSYRNSVELTHERWNSDVQALVEKLRRVMTEPPSQGANQNPRPEPSYVAPPPPMPERQQTPFSAAVAPAVTKRFPRKIVKWCLVVFMVIMMLGYIGNDDTSSALVAAAIAVLLGWDRFKWFVAKPELGASTPGYASDRRST